MNTDIGQARRFWGIAVAGTVVLVGVSAWLLAEGLASRSGQVGEIAVGRATGETPSQPMPTLGQVPEFALTERSGQMIARDHLQGSVWVANFMFTRCPGPCPQISQRLGDLQRTLRHEEGVMLVSISVDPDHDSPEVLASYAEDYGADPERWLFLTGEKQSIIDLAIDGFKLTAGDDPNLHSVRLALVDRQGRIRGYYQGRDDESLRQLRQDIRKLLAE